MGPDAKQNRLGTSIRHRICVQFGSWRPITMKTSRGERMARVGLILLIAITGLVFACNDYQKIAFPVVTTLSADVDDEGELKVTLEGRIELDEKFNDDIAQRGFVISSEATLPTIDDGRIIESSTIDGKLFSAIVDDSLTYNINTYYVRAFVRVDDGNRNTIFYDEGFKEFSFNTHLRVLSISGLTSVRNDTVSITGLIESRDFAINDLVIRYGHIISVELPTRIGGANSKAYLVNTSEKPIQSDIATTVARLKYNTDYYYRTVAITATDTIYSDTSSFSIRGGFSRVTSIPEKLKSGVVATTDDGTTAYAGIGTSLYQVTRPANGPFDSLAWVKVESPVDPGNDREFTGKNWEGGIAFIAQDSFYYMWGATPSNKNIINALSLSTGEWTVRNPQDIPQGQVTLRLASRRDAIAFKLNDDEVYLGFGLQNNPKERLNAMFRFYPGLDSIEQFCDPCLDKAVSGQVVNVLNGEVYIATGVFDDGNDIEVTSGLYKFDPDNSSDPFIELNPMPGAGRQNAFSFVLNDLLYIGMGNQSDELIVLPDICFYNAEYDTWKLIDEKFPGKPRTNAIAFVLDGRAYIGGGADADGNALDDMWTYTPPID